MSASASFLNWSSYFIQCAPHAGTFAGYAKIDLGTHQTTSAVLVKIDPIRKFALSLEAVTEGPHHNYSSFRVRGKIFVTIPPDEDCIHIFVGEEDREQALALYPECMEKLLWGAKVLGLRVELASAKPAPVKSLVRKAYETRVQKDAGPKTSGLKASKA